MFSEQVAPRDAAERRQAHQTGGERRREAPATRPSRQSRHAQVGMFLTPVLKANADAAPNTPVRGYNGRVGHPPTDTTCYPSRIGTRAAHSETQRTPVEVRHRGLFRFIQHLPVGRKLDSPWGESWTVISQAEQSYRTQPVVDAELNQVDAFCDVKRKRYVTERVILARSINEVVLDLGRPIARQGVFDASAPHPSPATGFDRLADNQAFIRYTPGTGGECATSIVNGELVMHPGAATFDVDEDTVSGKAGAARKRNKSIHFAVAVKYQADAAAPMAIDVGNASLHFCAPHQPARLHVEADLTAAEEPIHAVRGAEHLVPARCSYRHLH
jgi:hypothetical protein